MLRPIATSMFSDDEIERYARHILLKDIGGAGQKRLKSASIALIGAGGIGSPAGLYLAAAGVGRIGLIDDDAVSLSNLQRQILFASDDVEKPKVEAAAHRLSTLNPHVEIETHAVRLNAENGADLLVSYDLILDGSDNFATRFCVNDLAFRLEKPLISAAVGRWTGQIGIFTGRPCYRCLVPDMPVHEETCAQAGIVGALTGVMGAMAALEAIKMITHAGRALVGRLLIYEGLTGESRCLSLPPDPSCPVCSMHNSKRET